MKNPFITKTLASLVAAGTLLAGGAYLTHAERGSEIKNVTEPNEHKVKVLPRIDPRTGVGKYEYPADVIMDIRGYPDGLCNVTVEVIVRGENQPVRDAAVQIKWSTQQYIIGGFDEKYVYQHVTPMAKPRELGCLGDVDINVALPHDDLVLETSHHRFNFADTNGGTVTFYATRKSGDNEGNDQNAGEDAPAGDDKPAVGVNGSTATPSKPADKPTADELAEARANEVNIVRVKVVDVTPGANGRPAMTPLPGALVRADTACPANMLYTRRGCGPDLGVTDETGIATLEASVLGHKAVASIMSPGFGYEVVGRKTEEIANDRGLGGFVYDVTFLARRVAAGDRDHGGTNGEPGLPAEDRQDLPTNHYIPGAGSEAPGEPAILVPSIPVEEQPVEQPGSTVDTLPGEPGAVPGTPAATVPAVTTGSTPDSTPEPTETTPVVTTPVVATPTGPNPTGGTPTETTPSVPADTTEQPEIEQPGKVEVTPNERIETQPTETAPTETLPTEEVAVPMVEIEPAPSTGVGEAYPPTGIGEPYPPTVVESDEPAARPEAECRVGTTCELGTRG